MNGLLLEEYNKPYAYRDDIPVPLLEPGMLLIRVKVAGFCHTDLMVSSVCSHLALFCPLHTISRLRLRRLVTRGPPIRPIHTDITVCCQGDYPALLPMVPGHETVGVVVAVAEGVTDFEVGDRVGTLLFRGGCGRRA